MQAMCFHQLNFQNACASSLPCTSPLSQFVSYAVPMRPKIAETAVHGCLQSGTYLLTVDLRVMPATSARRI